MTIGTRARAEAAAWLARLQSEARDPIDEAGFRAWLEQEDAHRQAFDNVTTAWELAGGVVANYVPPHAPPRRIGLKITLVALAACVMAATVFAVLSSRLAPDHSQVYTTGPGDHLSINLAGGSAVVLTANSRLSVDRKLGATTFVLDSGEARFDIARRPFGQSHAKIIFGKREIETERASVAVAQHGKQAFAELLSGEAVISIRGANPPLFRDMLQGERAVFRSDPSL